MKRIWIVLMLVLLGTTAFAQVDDFYGLQFGEKYSERQIIAAIGENGTFKERNSLEEVIILKGYTFSDVKYGGKNYSEVSVVMTKYDELLMLSFSSSEKDIEGGDLIEYSEKRIEYFEKNYSPVLDQTELSFYVSSLLTALGSSKTYDTGADQYVTVIHNKNTNEVIEVYLSGTTLFSYAISLLNSTRPTIQSKFFGLQFGERVTESQIKSAVGYKGNYLISDVVADGIDYIFTKTIYAGTTWDYVTFTVDPQGRFYSFYAYNTYSDYSFDAENEANNVYVSMKSRLDEKYGEGSDSEDVNNGDKTIYFGNNNVHLVLSNMRSKSQGGKYLRYVTVSYTDSEISNRLQALGDEEL